MSTIQVFLFDGPDDTKGTAVVAQPGQSLMQAAVAAGIEGIAADCGGTLTCATCHVLVRDPWAARLPAIGDEESGMLDFTACARQPNSRLSCQIRLTKAMDGLQVDLPDRQY